MNMQHHIESIDNDFQVIAKTNTRWKPTADIEDAVDAIWAKEKSLRGDYLFNGELFGVLSVTNSEMVGQWFEYRYYLAARKQPELFEKCPLLIPAGVSGVLCHDDYVVFARRSEHVMCYPNQLELAPSGAIDPTYYDAESKRLDYKQLILQELEEEVELASDHVVEVLPYAVGRDMNDASYEVCIKLKPIFDLQTMTQFAAALSNSEYSSFDVIPTEQLTQYIEDNGDEVIPISRAMLEQLGLI